MQGDEQIIANAIAGLMSIGIGKRIRVPLVIKYVEDGNEITARAYEGRREEGERTETPEITVTRPKNANPQEMLHVIPHEVGHAVFSTLNRDDQLRIRQLAADHPDLSDYGNPERTDVGSSDVRHWRSGNEWFADIIAFMSRGGLQGELIRNEIVEMIARHGTPHAGINYKYYNV
jgi:hypothetical protein